MPTQNPELRKKHNQKYYAATKERFRDARRASANAIKIANRSRLADLLQTSSCTDCGTTEWRVLEFDHVRGEKTDSIARLLTCKWQRVIDEIAKCEIVCANCHRLRTYFRMDNCYRAPLA